MTRIHDTSHELLLTRHLNGIKLLRPKNSSIHELEQRRLLAVGDALEFPFSIFFTDMNHVIREINDRSWSNCGFQSRLEALGKTAANVCRNHHQIRNVFDNNRHVMRTRRLAILNEEAELVNPDVSLQCISIKFPWYDDNNRIAGIFGCALEISCDGLAKFADHFSMIANNFLAQPVATHNVLHGRKINDIYFSGREMELIQLLIRGKTIREISEILGIGYRTAESYYENVKCKSGVRTKSQLIEKLIDMKL